MTQTKLLVSGDNDELKGLGIVNTELTISGVLSDLQRRFIQEVEESGFKIYNDCVDISDDVSDNKRIGRKHNKPFYQKGRW